MGLSLIGTIPGESRGSEATTTLPASYYLYQTWDVKYGDGLAVWWNTQSGTLEVKLKDAFGTIYHDTTVTGSGGFLFIAPYTSKYTINFVNNYMFTSVTFTYSVEVVEIQTPITSLEMADVKQDSDLNGLHQQMTQSNSFQEQINAQQNNTLSTLTNNLYMLGQLQEEINDQQNDTMNNEIRSQDDINARQNSTMDYDKQTILSQLNKTITWANDIFTNINRTTQDLKNEDTTLNTNVNNVDSRLSSTKSDLNKEIQSTRTLAYGGLAIGVIGIMIGVIGIYIGRKMRYMPNMRPEPAPTPYPYQPQTPPPPPLPSIPPPVPSPTPNVQPRLSSMTSSGDFEDSQPQRPQPAPARPSQTFCGHCGKPSAPEMRFCPHCGGQKR